MRITMIFLVFGAIALIQNLNKINLQGPSIEVGSIFVARITNIGNGIKFNTHALI